VKNSPPQVRISLVGRSLEKLEKLKRAVDGTWRPGNGAPDLVVASSDNQSSIDRVISQSTVVVCTAGPFLRVASPIVASCARQGGLRNNSTLAPQYQQSESNITTILLPHHSLVYVWKGVDYVDITGETPFVRQTIDLHDATAKETGAFLVNM
jgi:saccharopine dehydrogenase (NAD+, L-lysine-forming)